MTKKSELEQALSYEISSPHLWYYRAKIIRVIDGDTCIALIDCGFNSIKMERLRLEGVDAPELRPRRGTNVEKLDEKARAKVATERVRELIEGKQVVIQTKKTGKFGRWLAVIYLPGDSQRTINQLLLEEGLAVQYPR